MENRQESVILVDLFDRPVGEMEKLQAHRQGRLHRAFSVFICWDGKMLLQKRSPEKYHSAGLTANTCCSHPRPGEELLSAASRRLEEEAGFSCRLKELFSFVYRCPFENGLTEYEYDHVLLGEYNGPVFPNPQEAQEMWWEPFPQLKQRLEEYPEQFCSWFLTAAPRVLEELMRKD